MQFLEEIILVNTAVVCSTVLKFAGSVGQTDPKTGSYLMKQVNMGKGVSRKRLCSMQFGRIPLLLGKKLCRYGQLMMA